MVSFEPYNFWITTLSARKSSYRFNTKIHSTMLCVSDLNYILDWCPSFFTFTPEGAGMATYNKKGNRYQFEMKDLN